MERTIIYLHGFGSISQSGTVGHLRKIFPKINVLAPDIPVNPAEALPFLRKYCEERHPDLIIGTSMGAMYAMQMYDYKRLCVNPALRMSELTEILKLGTIEYFQPTQTGETHSTITEGTIQQFREMEEHLFDGVNEENRQRCWGFFGDEDTTVNCREEFEQHFPHNIETFHGGHRMNNRIIDDDILPFVENLLDCRNCMYGKGDKVKFKSVQPSLNLRRFYNSKIEWAEYVGVILNVCTIKKGVYKYSIETTSGHWICLVNEQDIIEKLSDEQSL